MVDVLGTRLGRYDVRERIGRGGMATVYKAWDTNLDRWVAVKVLHDHLADDPEFNARFEREAKLVAALNHPNIVQIFDFEHIERDGQAIYYMVMPYITGQSLRALMEQRQAAGENLSIEEVEQVMDAVCGALSYAHIQGMIHRDVTPANILFNEGGGIVLADFGLAKLADSRKLTQTGMTTGTPIYMSPEQGTGDTLDSRSDLYSLGVILYEMLAGHPPFDGDTAFALIMKHVNDPVPLERLKGLDINIQRVVQRVLAKDPADRYASASDFLKDFKQAVIGSHSTAVRSGVGTILLPMPKKVKRKSKKRPEYYVRLLLFGIGALAIGGVVTILSNLTYDRPNNPQNAQMTLAVLPTLARPMGNSMTEASVEFTDDFSQSRHQAWQLTPEDPRIERQLVDGVLRIRNMIPSTAITTVIDPRSVDYSKPVMIEAALTLSEKSQTPSATGIIFRYQSDDAYYVFAVDGMRRYSIWIRKDGVWNELRNLADERWTANDAVKGIGQQNILKIIVNGTQLTGFVNNVQVFKIEEAPMLAHGGVGIYTATTSNPNETAPLAAVDVALYSVRFYKEETSTAVVSSK